MTRIAMFPGTLVAPPLAALGLAIVTGCGGDTGTRGDDAGARGAPDAAPARADAGEVFPPAPDASGPRVFERSPCTPEGWCWQNPQPQGNPLAAVWGSSPDDVWVGGEHGTLLHWDGAEWSVWMTGQIDAPITGLWGAAADDVWAVAGSRILRFDGDDWRVAVEFSTSFHDITGTGPDDVWIAGNSGTVGRFDGNSWALQTDLAAAPLVAIAAGGPNDVWAAGSFHAIHWDGTGWTSDPISGQPIHSLFAAGPGDFWAGGEGGWFHRVDDDWLAITAALRDEIHAVHGTGPSNVWAIGDGLVFHHDGTSYDQAALPGNHRGLWIDQDGGIAVGADATIHARSGAEWTEMTEGALRVPLRGIWASSATDLWAVGDTPEVLRGDGTAWTSALTTPGTGNNAVWGRASDDIYLCQDDGAVQHFDGADWAEVFRFPDEPCRDVRGLETDVWATGAADVARDAGDGWQIVLDRDNASFYSSIFPRAPDDIWTTGYQVVEHFNGEVWADRSPPDAVAVGALWVSAADDAWILERAGDSNLQHWTGGSYVEVDATPAGKQTRELAGIWARSSNDLWVAGGDGHLLHYDGSEWSTQPKPTTVDLHAVVGTEDGALWVTGDNASILRSPAP